VWDSRFAIKAGTLQENSAKFVPSFCVVGLAQLLPAPAFWITTYLAVVSRPLPVAALVVHRRDVFIYCGAQGTARGGAR
jgi:hypothetical protein